MPPLSQKSHLFVFSRVYTWSSLQRVCPIWRSTDNLHPILTFCILSTRLPANLQLPRTRLATNVFSAWSIHAISMRRHSDLFSVSGIPAENMILWARPPRSNHPIGEVRDSEFATDWHREMGSLHVSDNFICGDMYVHSRAWGRDRFQLADHH